MQTREKRLWSEHFLRVSAIIPVALGFGLFVMFQAAAHDSGIYFAVKSGESGVNALNQLFFSNLTHGQVIDLGRAFLGGAIAMWLFAGFIRYAKWHYANHGIALD